MPAVMQISAILKTGQIFRFIKSITAPQAIRSMMFEIAPPRIKPKIRRDNFFEKLKILKAKNEIATSAIYAAASAILP